MHNILQILMQILSFQEVLQHKQKQFCRNFNPANFYLPQNLTHQYSSWIKSIALFQKFEKDYLKISVRMQPIIVVYDWKILHNLFIRALTNTPSM